MLTEQARLLLEAPLATRLKSRKMLLKFNHMIILAAFKTTSLTKINLKNIKNTGLFPYILQWHRPILLTVIS